MEVMYSHCAGVDVHKKTVVACSITPDTQGNKQVSLRTFATMTADLLALSAWLSVQGVTHVAMESTGEFWKPVYNLLEGSFELLVVNAQHIKQVPGRKTDVKDAEWIAELLQHGLLRGSFIPPQTQRDLRDWTRQRTNLVQDRATVINRLQKVCEWSNIKLSAVVSDMTGVTARAMLEAIVHGQTQPQTLAELAKGRLRSKRAELERALTGIVREHHRFVLAQHLAQIDFLDEQIELYDAQITHMMAHSLSTQRPPAALGADAGPQPSQAAAPLSWQEALTFVDTLPGVSLRMAQLLLAEIGTDMSRLAKEVTIDAGIPADHDSASGGNSSESSRISDRLKNPHTPMRHSRNGTRHSG